ncbi:hypothetical protein BDW22DRAFT_160241 [Trametopsis cervina]|nr:hypothetical protein BDW22DRAFT_160241 [Trametopsis cervina]
MSGILAAAVLVGVLGAREARAQGTNATCGSTFSWMTNSRGQSPCLQAAYLNGACLPDPQDAYVYSLPEDFHYRPPTAQVATPCQCSTVFYAMIGACAACQGREHLPWSAWETNCTTVYNDVWPVPVPPGTSIPDWAFIDVATPDTFNVTAAQALALSDPAESSPAAAPPPPSTSSSVPPNSASASAVPPAAPTTSSTGSSGNGSGNTSGGGKKSNVGPIVGGVVGGIGGAALLAGLFAFFYTRHKRNTNLNNSTTTAPYTDAYGGEKPPPGAPTGGAGEYHGAYETTPYAPTQGEYQAVPYSPTSGGGAGGGAVPLYNPDDPSTFPGAAPMGSGSGYAPSHYTGVSQQHQPGLGQGQGQHQQFQQGQGGFQPGRYTGVAEV